MPGHPNLFEIGNRVPGTKWVVQAKLGEGGMGVVYGVVKEPGIQGAMKVMLPSFARNAGYVGRFLGEARMLARLKHPNIVQIIDFDQLANGTPFVVMERLKGRTLRAGLRAMRDRGGVTTSLAYEIIRQLCDGLHCAHAHDPPIVHRDVKPENIFMHVASSDAVVIKLLDFGIATVLDGKEDRQALGTPRYMAPELLLGKPASPQADIYSAALVLYQMLTGRFPWDVDVQSTSAMVHAHLKLEPAPPSRYAPRIPPIVDECIMQALAKSPTDRPSSAYEFGARLCLLQFVSDSASKSDVDVNTTAPTLATLADAVDEWIDHERNDTERGSIAPPVEGRSLELAPIGILGATERVSSPARFSTRTLARGVAAMTGGAAAVDHSAPTHTQAPSTTRVPRFDTERIRPARESGALDGSESADRSGDRLPPSDPGDTSSTRRPPIDLADGSPIRRAPKGAATESPPAQTPMVAAVRRRRAGDGLPAHWQHVVVGSAFVITVVSGLAVIRSIQPGRVGANVGTVAVDLGSPPTAAAAPGLLAGAVLTAVETPQAAPPPASPPGVPIARESATLKSATMSVAAANPPAAPAATSSSSPARATGFPAASASRIAATRSHTATSATARRVESLFETIDESPGRP